MPWNDSIKWQGKNLHNGDIRNYFHHISSNTSTSSNYFSCNQQPWWQNRYVGMSVQLWNLQLNIKLRGLLIYRRSLVSAVFGSPANRTIGKTALIGDWFSTKIVIWDFWNFKVPFFAHFQENSMIWCSLFKVPFYAHFIEFSITNFDFLPKF